MRSFTLVVLVLAFVLADAMPAASAGHVRKSRKAKETGTDPAQIIYDLTVPWPFRRHHAGAPTVADSDGDGVLDGSDECPGTPRGAKVDERGCPRDGDGDGVPDGLDKCPGTPKGAVVDESGCPKDGDGDGVSDGLDKCPNTPKGAVVDASGCPKDSDGDGVPDGIDRCANTPAGVAVDDHGCPVDMSKTETEFLDTGVIRASNIRFEFNKADLAPESNRVLDEIGTILVQWPELQVEIAGHTDSKGSEKYNQRLSEARAQSVRDYLVAKFPKIVETNLTVKGYGESSPIASNDTEQGRAQNRRVEFTVLNKETLKREVERKGLKNRR